MNITNNATSHTYTFPIVTQLVWAITVQATPMPIPLQDIPLLLNFGGASPTIQITFQVTSTQTSTSSVVGDWTLLVAEFASGSDISGYVLNAPEVGETNISGIVTSLQLTANGGEGNAGEIIAFSGQMSFARGTVIG